MSRPRGAPHRAPKPPALHDLPDTVAPRDYLTLVWQYLTAAVCDQIFDDTRERERQRKWTLFVLLKFWIALVQRPGLSQTDAVVQCARKHPLFPFVTASAASFFQRIQRFRPAFFQNLFAYFTAQLEAHELPGAVFQTALPISAAVFPHVYILDGSRLDKVAHRLQLTQKTRAALMPGLIEVAYDLRRGHLHTVTFEPDGLASELPLFATMLPDLPQSALVVADRFYARPAVLEWAVVHDVALVVRYSRWVKKKPVDILRRVRTRTMQLDDQLVALGLRRAHGAPPVLVRYIKLRQQVDGRWQTRHLVTTVLDPAQLPAEAAVALYTARWTVECVFRTLKDTLDLGTLFNGSPPAVAQQVYTTAILYNALRVSQAQLATQLGIPPERLSPDRLFPQLIRALVDLTLLENGAHRYRDALQAQAPETVLPPVTDLDFTTHPDLQLVTRALLVDHRGADRIVRRKRRRWSHRTSFAKLPGGKQYLEP